MAEEIMDHVRRLHDRFERHNDVQALRDVAALWIHLAHSAAADDPQRMALFANALFTLSKLADVDSDDRYPVVIQGLATAAFGPELSHREADTAEHAFVSLVELYERLADPRISGAARDALTRLVDASIASGLLLAVADRLWQRLLVNGDRTGDPRSYEQTADVLRLALKLTQDNRNNTRARLDHLVEAVSRLAARESGPELLREVIAARRRVLEMVGPGDTPTRSEYSARVVRDLMTLHDRVGDVAPLVEALPHAIVTAQEADADAQAPAAAILAHLVAVCTSASSLTLPQWQQVSTAAAVAADLNPDRSAVAELLLARSKALRHILRYTGDLTVAQKAVTVAREALDTAGPAFVPVCEQALGRCLRLYAGLARDAAAAREAADRLAAFAAAHPEDSIAACDHGMALAALAELGADAAPAAETVLTGMLARFDLSAVTRSNALAALAAIRHQQANAAVAATVKVGLLEEAAQLLRESIDAAQGHADDQHVTGVQAQLVEVLVEGLLGRVATTPAPQPAEFDEAIGIAETVLASGLLTPANITYLLWLTALAHSARHWSTGTAADLDQVIDADLAVLDSLDGADDQADLAGMLTCTVAAALRERADLHGRRADLNRGIMLLRQAIDQVPQTSAVRPTVASTLGELLRERFARWGTGDDIHEAVMWGRDGTADGAVPGIGSRLAQLSASLRERYERFGSPDDLAEATRAAERATAIAATMTTADAANIAATLIAHHDASGNPADMAKAIAHMRHALLSDHRSDSDGRVLMNMGSFLARRFQRFGATADLDEAIGLLTQGVEQTPPHHPRRAVRLLNLAHALRDRANILTAQATAARKNLDEQWRAALPDLDHAVDIGHQAIEAMPVGFRHRAEGFHQLSATYLARSRISQEHPDLMLAVSYARDALYTAHTPDQMILLGQALHERAATTHSRTDLEEAIVVLGEAVDSFAVTAPDTARHPRAADALIALGNLHLARAKPAGDLTAPGIAVGLYREAAAITAARTDVRLSAARHWADTAHRLEQFDSAAQAYDTAIDLLPALAWAGAPRADRETRIASYPGLAADAAANALTCRRPRRAVELLEQGRGVLWTQLLGMRTELDQLRLADSRLARRLDAVRRELDSPTETSNPISTAEDRDYRMSLAAEYAELVDRARRIDRFQHFLKIPPYAELQRIPVSGPVVYVNISRRRCDAIVVRTDGDPEVISLTVTHGDVHRQAASFTRALHQYETSPRLRADRTRLEEHTSSILAWLWRDVARHILHALPEVGADDLPRIWWCPTGPMTALPLHAAGDHNTPGESVIDLAVSSYIPTLHAFGRLRAGVRDETSGLLTVGVPDTAGQSPLAVVTQELQVVRHAVATVDHTGLDGPAANIRDVGQALGRHRWAHLTCHGVQNYDRPSEGGLRLADGTLTVTDLINHSTGGEFVVLSACQTAAASTVNIDEAINLAAALSYAGWHHIVAAQWSVWASAAHRVTQDLYRHLTMTGQLVADDAARVLHAATRLLRDERPRHPTRWAPFIHLGR